MLFRHCRYFRCGNGHTQRHLQRSYCIYKKQVLFVELFSCLSPQACSFHFPKTKLRCGTGPLWIFMASLSAIKLRVPTPQKKTIISAKYTPNCRDSYHGGLLLLCLLFKGNYLGAEIRNCMECRLLWHKMTKKRRNFLRVKQPEGYTFLKTAIFQWFFGY